MYDSAAEHQSEAKQNHSGFYGPMLLPYGSYTSAWYEVRRCVLGHNTEQQAATAAGSSKDQSRQQPVAASSSSSSSSSSNSSSIRVFQGFSTRCPSKKNVRCSRFVFLNYVHVRKRYATAKAMIDRPRHGLSFVRTRTTADDDESKRIPLSLLLAMP